MRSPAWRRLPLCRHPSAARIRPRQRPPPPLRQTTPFSFSQGLLPVRLRVLKLRRQPPLPQQNRSRRHPRSQCRRIRCQRSHPLPLRLRHHQPKSERPQRPRQILVLLRIPSLRASGQRPQPRKPGHHRLLPSILQWRTNLRQRHNRSLRQARSRCSPPPRSSPWTERFSRSARHPRPLPASHQHSPQRL